VPGVYNGCHQMNCWVAPACGAVCISAAAFALLLGQAATAEAAVGSTMAKPLYIQCMQEVVLGATWFEVVLCRGCCCSSYSTLHWRWVRLLRVCTRPALVASQRLQCWCRGAGVACFKLFVCMWMLVAAHKRDTHACMCACVWLLQNLFFLAATLRGM
jgi:hypothetical protein